MFGRLGKLSCGGIWCALRCEVKCGHEKMCLTVIDFNKLLATQGL